MYHCQAVSFARGRRLSLCWFARLRSGTFRLYCCCERADRILRTWQDNRSCHTLSNEEGEANNEANTEYEDDLYVEEEHLSFTTELVSSSNQFIDYIYRSNARTFDSLNLYSFITKTYKISEKSETDRENKRTHNSIGRPINERGRFLPAHPQFDSHLLRLKSKGSIPVILGPTIPQKDQQDEKWCRLMLLLFKPWRKLSDLIHPEETWEEAFAMTDFDEASLGTMDNIELLVQPVLLSNALPFSSSGQYLPGRALPILRC